MSPFHSGEIEVQARLAAREDAERVGRIVTSEITPTVAPVLRRQRMAVAASLDGEGWPWASLLTGRRLSTRASAPSSPAPTPSSSPPGIPGVAPTLPIAAAARGS